VRPSSGANVRFPTYRFRLLTRRLCHWDVCSSDGDHPPDLHGRAFLTFQSGVFSMRSMSASDSPKWCPISWTSTWRIRSSRRPPAHASRPGSGGDRERSCPRRGRSRRRPSSERHAAIEAEQAERIRNAQRAKCPGVGPIVDPERYALKTPPEFLWNLAQRRLGDHGEIIERGRVVWGIG